MKITLIILLAFFAVAVAGMFAYNGYESNQIAKRDIELREKLVKLQEDQIELAKAKAEQETRAEGFERQAEPYIKKVKTLKENYNNVPEKNKNTTSDDDWKYVIEQLN